MACFFITDVCMANIRTVWIHMLAWREAQPRPSQEIMSKILANPTELGHMVVLLYKTRLRTFCTGSLPRNVDSVKLAVQR